MRPLFALPTTVRAWKKDVVDFEVTLTKNHPIWWDARTGQGTVGANSFPAGNEQTGELKCWAVTNGEVPGEAERARNWNHLKGEAEIYDFFDGTAYEYTAWAFKAKTDFPDREVKPGKKPVRELLLDGVNYERCPQYLIDNFTPNGRTIHDHYHYVDTHVSVVGCTEDLTQDRKNHFTKLTFDFFNEHEVKFTEPFKCADTFHEFSLADLDSDPSDVLTTIGTDAAYFRMFGLASDQCPQFTPLTEEVGLVGIIASTVEIGGVDGTIDGTTPTSERVAVGTNLVGAGRDPGSILWNANPEPEESKQ